MAYRAKIRPVLLSIRTKLTLPYILLAVLIAVGGGLVVSQSALNSLEDRFATQLIETRKLASDAMVRKENDMLSTLRLLSHTSGMGEAIGLRDRKVIGELAYPITFNAGTDAVLILDRRGAIVIAILKSKTSAEYELRVIGGDLNALPFVSKVVRQEVDGAGDKYAGISNADWGTYLFVSGPVQDQQGQFAGVILVGESLEDLGRQIREETLSQATIYDLAFHPVTSTFADIPAAPEMAPGTALARDETHGLMRDLVIGNIAYTELLSPWVVRSSEQIGILGTALPKAFLVRTSQITRFNITAITILAILLATLFGISLAGSITRPILRLKEAASAVSGGNLGVRVDTRGGDEVGVLAEAFNTMVANVKRSKQDLLDIYDETIEGWSKALEMRDPGTMGHTARVVEMTLTLARAMHIDDDNLVHIRRGAFLHDIGKMSIPDSILLKPSSLTEDEWKEMRMHPVFALELLRQIVFLQPAMDIPVFHHEKWDGSGYPYGLAGKYIPLAARIFAVIDVWDALTSDRPYRTAWSAESALERIQQDSGRHFDPEVVSAFTSLLEERQAVPKRA